MKFIYTAILIFTISNLFTQEDICTCAAYNSLSYAIEDYSNILPPESIIKNGKYELNYYTIVKHRIESSLDTIHKSYNEISFKFGNHGFIYEIIFYNRLGEYHSKIKFKRSNNKTTSKTFLYLDDAGNESDFTPPQTTDYFYNSDNKLVKTKNRGYNGEVLPDSLTTYLEIEYDSKSRVIKNATHFYFNSLDNKISKSVAYTKYNDKLFTSETSVWSNEQLSLTINSKYDKNGNVIYSKSFNHLLNDYSGEQTMTYDSENRLIELKVQTFGGGGSECPDNGNFEEQYKYDQNGILSKVIHMYKNYECEIYLKY